MFEYNVMNQAATVRELQQRITEMQPLRLDERALPTHRAVRGLLPGGALRAGTTLTVRGSLSLALALISELSASGAWCGAIGVPELGLEAATNLGIALERLILVPHPGPHEISITATLSEVLAAIVLRPSTEVRSSDAARLAAKLRDRGTALIVLGPWPGADGQLTAISSHWSGLGTGHGLLDHQQIRVQSTDRRGVLRHTVHFAGGRLQ